MSSERPPDRWAYILNGVILGFNETYARSHIEELRDLTGHEVLIETERMTVFIDQRGKIIGWVAQSMLDGSKI